MSTILITGAARGLGLEFTTQYLQEGHCVIACARVPESPALLALEQRYGSHLRREALDLAQESAIELLAERLEGTPIDVLLLNAGVLADDCARLGELSLAGLREAFTLNSIAPALLIQALRANVIASQDKVIAALSTRVASIADNGSGGMYGYRASKTALNQIVQSAGRDLLPEGVKTILLHPGWVQTDMGGPNATFTPQESVAGMRQRIAELEPSSSGQFVSFAGEALPW